MHGHSDTESDSEHENDTVYKNGINYLRFRRSTLSSGEKNTGCNELVRDQDALSAVEQIKSVDLFIVHKVYFHWNVKGMVTHCFIGYRHSRSGPQSLQYHR